MNKVLIINDARRSVRIMSMAILTEVGDVFNTLVNLSKAYRLVLPWFN